MSKTPFYMDTHHNDFSPNQQVGGMITILKAIADLLVVTNKKLESIDQRLHRTNVAAGIEFDMPFTTKPSKS